MTGNRKTEGFASLFRASGLALVLLLFLAAPAGAQPSLDLKKAQKGPVRIEAYRLAYDQDSDTYRAEGGRLQWPGRNLVFFLMLSTMMIPAQALIVPQYVFFHRIGWIGSFNPLVIPGYFAGGAAMIFLLRQAMAQIPKEIDESAFVDGASHIQIWWYLVLPLVKAPLATVATFLFIGYWNNLLGPLIYTQSSELYTLPVYVAQLYNINSTTQPWPSIMAAAVLTTVPLILVFFFAQRFILESVVITGLKG